jgi:vancomycin resistance protein YoaR
VRLAPEALVAQELVHRGQVPKPHRPSVGRDACFNIGVLRRVRTAVTVAVLVVAGTVVATVAARDAYYVDRPLPGVAVGEADLARPVTVVVAGERFRVPPERVLRVNRVATDHAAREAGRYAFLTRVQALADPSPPAIAVEPVLTAMPDEVDRLAAELGARLPKPTPATVAMRGLQPRVTPASSGKAVDRRALVQALRRAALGGPRTIEATLEDVAAGLDTEAAEQAAETARLVVSAPVQLRFGDRAVGTLSRKRLARLLRFAPSGEQFDVTFDHERLSRAVRPSVAKWRRQATNARFVVRGKTVRILPSRPGLDVNPKKTLAALTAAVHSADRTAAVALRETRADRTTRDAEKLGIRERISTFTTEMGVSSSNRIHNVHLMAQYIDGTIVEPGDSFSFNERVGPRTVERGFREGQMIIGSLLLPSIGGGVCQTATTLFNNAFELGLPVQRRYNHSFYISHYPMGRDATVSWGGPDLVFRNDLKTGILIKTSYTNETLTFSFYGTDPQRRVVSTTGPQVNWRQPQTTYAYDPYAPRGSVRTVAGSNQPGFDVTVTRKVYERGKLRRKDSFTSAYIAVGPTQIYGPGRTIPGPYFTLPRV